MHFGEIILRGGRHFFINERGHGGITSVMDPEYYKNLFKKIIEGQENPKFPKFTVPISTSKNVQYPKYHP